MKIVLEGMLIAAKNTERGGFRHAGRQGNLPEWASFGGIRPAPELSLPL